MKKVKTETKKKKEREELPDYTVADMNIEGMPWNTGRHWKTPGIPGTGTAGPSDRGRMEDPERFGPDGTEDAGRRKKPRESETPRYTKEESRQMVWLGIKAGLLIGGVFLVGALVFLLFCLYVWF